MKSIYYQFVNFIQTIPTLWFAVIWAALLLGIFFCIVKFFNSYNEKTNKYEKIGLFILAIVLLAAIIYLTYIRR